jgi:hypothetical protein
VRGSGEHVIRTISENIARVLGLRDGSGGDVGPSFVGIKDDMQVAVQEQASESPAFLDLSEVETSTYFLLLVFADMCGTPLRQIAPNKMLREDWSLELLGKFLAAEALCDQQGLKIMEVLIHYAKTKYGLPISFGRAPQSPTALSNWRTKK